MKTPRAFSISKALLLTICFGSLLTSCQKEDVSPTSLNVGQDPVERAAPAWFVAYDAQVTAGFSVYEWKSNCVTPYGTITNSTSNSIGLPTTTPPYVSVSPGNCTVSSNRVNFETGTSYNTYGKWYLIYPQTGPGTSTRKGLKVRFKNLMGTLVGSDLYDQGILYNPTTNSWNFTSATASGAIDAVQITPGIMTLCPPKQH